MSSKEPRNTSSSLVKGDARAIEQLKQAVASGEHWYLALLKAIKLWKSSEEDYKGRYYRYLIDEKPSIGYCWQNVYLRK